MKLKFSGIKEDVDTLIKETASNVSLYDTGFPDEAQCSGYHAFKEMCLIQEDICTYEELKEFRERKDSNYGERPPIGYYLLCRLHPNIREICIDAVRHVRNVIKNNKTK
jgi:hypothetical protein